MPMDVPDIIYCHNAHRFCLCANIFLQRIPPKCQYITLTYKAIDFTLWHKDKSHNAAYDGQVTCMVRCTGEIHTYSIVQGYGGV